MTGTVLEWLTMIGEWGIVATILYEGHIALKEYRSSRLFEAIKFMEDPDTRSARKVIYEKLVRTSPAAVDWWEKDEQLADAAATVCAKYNIVGAVTKDDQKLRQFLVKQWAYNICSTHEALKDYLRYREEPNRSQAGIFARYRELYREAKMAKAAAVRSAVNSNSLAGKP